MSTTSDWSFAKERLGKALSEFEATSPTPIEHDRVHETLMDLLKDPLGWGREEENNPGVWWGHVLGTSLGIIYVPNMESHKIYVANIGPRTL